MSQLPSRRDISVRHRTPVWRAALVALGVWLLSSPGVALAQSPAEIRIARQIAGEGLAAYKAGDFELALRQFDEARAIYPSAQILRMTGYTLLALERWEQAAELLRASLDSTVTPLGATDRADVEQELGKALSHFGKVTVSSKAKGAELVVDGGEPRKLPLDSPLVLLEGKHRLTVSAKGYLTATQEPLVSGGTTVEIAIDLEKEKPPEPPKPVPLPVAAPRADEAERKAWFPHQRAVGFAVAGTGVAVGAAALATAFAAAELRGNVEDDIAKHEEYFGKDCAKNDFTMCRFDIEVVNHDADRADSLRDASVGLGVASLVLLAGGVTLALLAPSKAPTAKAAVAPRLACGPLGTAGAACRGAF